MTAQTMIGYPAPAGVAGAAIGAPLPMVSVVVPAYNEALVIDHTLTTLFDYLHTLDGRYRWEIVVVDDGSTDGTGEIAEAFASGRAEVRVLRHMVNFRVGQALQYAFHTCRGDYVVAVDCDLSYSPDHIERLLAALRDQHARVAIASPYHRDGRVTGIPLVRRTLSRWANRILHRAWKGDLTTFTGMVRAYDRRFLSSLDLKAMGPEVNTEILYKARLLRARIVEIPGHLDWTGQRERNKSRGHRALHARNVTALQLFSSFLFRPFAFFVVPGLVLLALALWTLGSVVLTSYANFEHVTGTFDSRWTQAVAATFDERPQSFIVGGVFLILSVQLMSLGILALQAKRYFEELFHLGTSIRRDEIARQERDSHADGEAADARPRP